MFSKTIKEDSLEINMEVVDKPNTIDKYIQAWHNQIWEHGFMGMFKGKDYYNKTKTFVEYMHTNLAVKQVVFRYEFISQMALNSIFLKLWIKVVFTKFSLNVILRYFMWELLLASTMDKSKLPFFLTS